MEDGHADARASDRSSPSRASDEIARGAALGRYVILKHVGRGGMGVVYLAFDGELDRKVAIKVLRAEATGGQSVGETRARLLREAQAMAKVSHPNVVAVYDVGTFGDEVFVAMEYVSGATLREWRARTKPRTRAIIEAYVQAGHGLGAAHAAGILHRDFKPENVLVDESGHVKVLDFGLARLVTEPDTDADAGSVVESAANIGLHDTGLNHAAALSTPLTRQGSIMGTPAYMAPEQLVGEPATARSDQFAFCIALYEALYGDIPFEGDSPTSLLSAIHARRFRPVSRDTRVPRGVRRVLLRGLSSAPEKRFASVAELLTALERAVSARRRWLLAGSAVGAAILVTSVTALRPAPAKLCRGAEEAIAPAWNAARAEEVHRAFVNASNARGEDAFTHTRPLLDRYAASWIKMHTDTCEATRVRGEQSEEGLDLRMACLGQREKEMKATVDLLAQGDAKMVNNAVEAAAHLTPVDTCVDLAVLRAPFAPPKSEDQRKAVDELRRKVVEVQALEHAGRWDDALPRATTLVEEATAVGYGPVTAEALLYRGEAEFELNKPGTAATYFAAGLQAESSRHDIVAARAWIALVKEDYNHDNLSEAHRAALLADAAVTRAEDDATLRADLLAAQGWLAYSEDDQKNGLEFARRALAIRERVLGESHPDTLIARSDLADRLWDQGDVEQSLVLYEGLLRSRTALLGEGHPSTVRSLGDIAEAKTELGEYDSAVELWTRVVALATLPYRIAEGRAGLAAALVGAGRLEDGLATFEDGIGLMKSLDQPIQVAGQYSDFARALVQRGANAQAEAKATLALRRTDNGEGTGKARGIRALCKQRRGDAAGAIDDANAALDAKAKYLGERADLIPLLARGQAFLVMHRSADALADLERAFALGEKYKGDRAIRADLRFALARALVANQGDAARASDLAARAASNLDAVGLAPQAAIVRAWVAANASSLAAAKP